MTEVSVGKSISSSAAKLGLQELLTALESELAESRDNIDAGVGNRTRFQSKRLGRPLSQQAICRCCVVDRHRLDGFWSWNAVNAGVAKEKHESEILCTVKSTHTHVC